MKKIFLLFPLLFLAACNSTPEAKLKTTNPDLVIDRLGTVDGCTIYRFLDGTTSHYFVKCVGASSMAMNTIHQGKIIRTEEIPTQ